MGNIMKFLAARICFRFSACYRSEIVVIVEAELDAMLIIQEAGDLCACIALGGAQKRPCPLSPSMDA